MATEPTARPEPFQTLITDESKHIKADLDLAIQILERSNASNGYEELGNYARKAIAAALPLLQHISDTFDNLLTHRPERHMSQPLVIYHANCPDGFTAAWIARKAFGPDCEFIPAHYGDSPPDCTGRSVYILDFSYKRPVTLGLQLRP